MQICRKWDLCHWGLSHTWKRVICLTNIFNIRKGRFYSLLQAAILLLSLFHSFLRCKSVFEFHIAENKKKERTDGPFNATIHFWLGLAIHVCVCARARAHVRAKLFQSVQLCSTLWTVACQSPLSMEFSRQERCSGLPCPPPGDLLDPGIEPAILMSLALAGGFFTTSTAWEAPVCAAKCC